MSVLARKFNEQFSPWEIELPPDSVATRSRGKIIKRGWAIWFLFGADEVGEYLDYYSSHRMAGDEHVRIRPDGTTESLPSISSIRVVSSDSVEDARLDEEFIAANQYVSHGALKIQVQHYRERMLHGKKLQAVEH